MKISFLDLFYVNLILKNLILDIQEPPTLTLDDKDKIYKVKENEDVTFTVKLSGTPKPEAEWFTSGKVVKKSPRIAKTSDDQSASLTIKKVVDDDVGEYTVKVKNPCGEAEANLTLVIMSKFGDCFFYKIQMLTPFIIRRKTFSTWCT